MICLLSVVVNLLVVAVILEFVAFVVVVAKLMENKIKFNIFYYFWNIGRKLGYVDNYGYVN